MFKSFSGFRKLLNSILCDGAVFNYENGVAGHFVFKYKGEIVWEFPGNTPMFRDHWRNYERKDMIHDILRWYTRVPRDVIWKTDVFHPNVDGYGEWIAIRDVYNAGAGFDGLIAVLKALDRRIGKRRLKILRAEYIYEGLTRGLRVKNAIYIINLRLNEPDQL